MFYFNRFLSPPLEITCASSYKDIVQILNKPATCVEVTSYYHYNKRKLH